MSQVFAKGMMQELNHTRDMIQRLFPHLEQLLRYHLNFLQKLRERQRLEAVVSHIGDVLLSQVILSDTFLRALWHPIVDFVYSCMFMWHVLMIFPLLSCQFDGQNADDLCSYYSQFCSQHKEALSLYKDILKTDRKFQTFVKVCRGIMILNVLYFILKTNFLY